MGRPMTPNEKKLHAQIKKLQVREKQLESANHKWQEVVGEQRAEINRLDEKILQAAAIAATQSVKVDCLSAENRKLEDDAKLLQAQLQDSKDMAEGFKDMIHKLDSNTAELHKVIANMTGVMVGKRVL